jgi:hypothetical protein
MISNHVYHLCLRGGYQLEGIDSRLSRTESCDMYHVEAVAQLSSDQFWMVNE